MDPQNSKDLAQKMYDWFCSGAGMQHEMDWPFAKQISGLDNVDIDGYMNLEALAEFILEHQSSETKEQSAWIRMKDKQPPEGVLVLADTGIVPTVGQRCGEWFDILGLNTETDTIEHWMPLPAIPKPYNG